MKIKSLLALPLILLGQACATPDPKPAPQPAILSDPDTNTMMMVRAALAKALGQKNIILGVGDYSNSSVISVMPPPPGSLEGNSPARPILFNLFMDEHGCFALRSGSEERIPLDGVNCEPFE